MLPLTRSSSQPSTAVSMGLVLEDFAGLVRALNRARGIGEAGDVFHQRVDVVGGNDSRVGEVVALLVIDAGTHLEDQPRGHALIGSVSTTEGPKQKASGLLELDLQRDLAIEQ